MARADYNTKVVTTSREITAQEKFLIKDFNDAIGLDSVVTDSEGIILDIDIIAEVQVHNEHAKDDKDYTTIVIITRDGTKYTTSSNSVRDAISDIMDECMDEGIEDYKLKIFKKPSKNYAGKSFMTASIVF